MKTKAALPWFGSDATVAPQLGALLDDCKHVTIPFCGGMGILPHLKARGIVANDLHDLAINFYRVMAEYYGSGIKEDCISRCEGTVSHPAVMQDVSEICSNPQHYRKHTKAWAFWAQCWIGRKGKGGTKNQGGKPSVRRTANGGNNATRIQSAAADLEAWAEEFKRCEFTCEDFRECLAKVADKPECGVYVDAPWFGAGDGYLHSFTTQDHGELCGMLLSLRNAKVVVRYGDCPEIRGLYDDPCWKIIEATSRTQANKPLGELWITNEDAAKRTGVRGGLSEARGEL